MKSTFVEEKEARANTHADISRKNSLILSIGNLYIIPYGPLEKRKS